MRLIEKNSFLETPLATEMLLVTLIKDKKMYPGG
jgi:hypothetical protein